jgi:DNA-binding response OmpR family regulator
VLTSDHSNPEIMIQAIRYQVGDFLLRPFEDEFLLERLDELTQKQQVSRQKEECLERLQELMDKLAVMKKTTNHNDSLIPNSDGNQDHILQVGNFILDLETRQVFMDGSCEFHLTTTNFNYLKVLAIHAPRAVSFTNLVKEAQGYTLSKQESKSLAFWHIYKLRKELSTGLDYDIIQNVRGFGYKLNFM